PTRTVPGCPGVPRTSGALVRAAGSFGAEPALDGRLAPKQHSCSDVDAGGAVLAATALDVRLDGVFGGSHGGGDLFHRDAGRVEHQGASLLVPESRAFAPVDDGERFGHRAVAVLLAARRAFDGSNQFDSRFRLGDEAPGTVADRREDGGSIRVPAHHDRLATRGGEGLHLGADGDLVFQVQVEHDHVDRELRVAEQPDPGRLTGDHADAGLVCEPGGYPLENQGVIVDDGNTNSAFSGWYAPHGCPLCEPTAPGTGH